MKLSKIQREIITHRLEVPDAMAEVHVATHGGSYDKAEERISRAAKNFIERRAFDCMPTDIELSMLADIMTNNVFADMAYEAVTWGEITRQKAQGIQAAQDDLQRKIKEYLEGV
tara:strand:- start:1400 stop:1741 length:342 start_codon:yes stop_codon:yes gene_type:complete